MLAGAQRAHELQGADHDHAELPPIDDSASPEGRLRTPSRYKHFFAWYLDDPKFCQRASSARAGEQRLVGQLLSLSWGQLAMASNKIPRPYSSEAACKASTGKPRRELDSHNTGSRDADTRPSMRGLKRE